MSEVSRRIFSSYLPLGSWSHFNVTFTSFAQAHGHTKEILVNFGSISLNMKVTTSCTNCVFFFSRSGSLYLEKLDIRFVDSKYALCLC